MKCVSCHAPGELGEKVPLLTRDDLVNSPLELAIPGNAAESGLVIAITRPDSDEKRMPPPKTGAARLKEEEIAAIRTWIDNGAKDD